MRYSGFVTELVLIAHNLRSSHNVGSLLRTAEGLGVGKVWLTGYSPYPLSPSDKRLPHLARRTDTQITKTALSAEKLVPWEHAGDIQPVIEKLRADGFTVAGLEQTPGSVALPDYKPPQKLALIVGRETEGLEPEILALCDLSLEIPMPGRKESFNVVQAAAMALYHLRFTGPEL
jgi:tRNA G18 (ribose-2'-O)-methylase SpoU